MYQVLIVDDEYHAVQGVQSGVNWDRFQVTSIHTAYNVRQAKEIWGKFPIDLMICDIEMPEESGIELLRWVREHYPSKESIFLTCHSDFEYAKQAVQLGSLDYLLKPVRYSELEAVVQKALDNIKKQREQDDFILNYKHYYQLWKTHHPLIVERFWLDLLHRTISSNREQIRNVLENQRIPYTDDMRFLPIFIGVHRWRQGLTLREEKIMEYALRNAAEHSFLKYYEGGQMIQWNRGQLLAILPCAVAGTAGETDLREQCRLYIQFCNDYFHCDLSCYIGNPVYIHQMVNKIESLSAFHKNNVSTMNCEFLIKDHYEETATGDHSGIHDTRLNVWAELLKQGEQDKLLSDVEAYLGSLKRNKGMGAKLLQHFYQDFTQMMYYTLRLKGLKAHQISSDPLLAPEEAVAATRSVVHLMEWVSRVVDQAAKYIREVEEGQTIIDKVKHYIAENLEQSLSRKDISNSVYLNPDYLARLFKKRTGMSINDYILEERMKLAAQLLSKSQVSIGKVAASVGFSSFSYFSKMFRIQFGLTPQDYRAKNAER
ncbi:response regulator [Paenibacillus sp.]|uniref:response regulator n=1 Tax=Paenibacillus sp. TaxID=58172 RepID=UPI0028114017|nr:response regulator [Paenibacillus sp.]